MMIVGAIAVAALLTGLFGLWLLRRQRLSAVRGAVCLRDEMKAGREESLRDIQRLVETIERSEQNAQTSLELLRDGRLAASSRARALRMLQSGMAADTVAVELGMAKTEMRLLEKIGILLSPRN